MRHEMKCFYYKMVVRKTGKAYMSNFGWAESFEALKRNQETRVVACIQITEAEFHALRAQGI